jgi:Subtilase family
MSDRLRKIAAPTVAAIAVVLALPAPGQAHSRARSLPLSLKHTGSYSARRVCAMPPAGHGSCLALRVVRAGQAARYAPGVSAPANAAQAPSPASGETGYTPEQLHTAYTLPTETTAAQTIAIVDAYNDPTAEQDLQAYDEEFHLPACTKANGCFRKFNELGEERNYPFPVNTEALEEKLAEPPETEAREQGEEAEGWGMEISLDIETAHEICQSCKIALFESSGTLFSEFATTERSAGKLAGVSEISNSWGGPECVESGTRFCEKENAAFNQPGIAITVSAGDTGYLNWQTEEGFGRHFAQFPASLPKVVSVGGTRLMLHEGTAAYGEETVWNGSGAGGGGCSVKFAAPTWQQETTGWSAVGCGGARAVSDVSADADPFTGVAVRYSRAEECFTAYPVEEGGEIVEGRLPNWCQIGGTSLAAPIIAATYALAGGAHGISYPAATLYENEVNRPASLHDVTIGSNAECNQPFNRQTGLSGCTVAAEAAHCSDAFICQARAGYDGPTGVGTPDGLEAFVPGNGVKRTPAVEPAPTPKETAPAPQPIAPVVVTPIVKPVLSHLALTVKALAALAGHRPAISLVAFSFTLSKPMHVRIAFARRVRSHRRTSWASVGSAFTTSGVRGTNKAHLKGRRSLQRGVYRLTLTLSSGTARSIQFTLG